MRSVLKLLTVATCACFAQNQATTSEPRIEIFPVQGNVYMLVGAGANIAVSVGSDGMLLVDAGRAELADHVLKAVLDLATQVAGTPQPNQCRGLGCPKAPFGWSSPALQSAIGSPARPKPVRYIVNTSVDADHTGGNARLAELPTDSKILSVTFPPVGVAPSAFVIAHENVLNRMSDEKTGVDSSLWPTETYRVPKYKLSEFFNGEGVQITHHPAAHTDGDSMVYFRYSDVIAAGDILNTTAYPSIDTARGGTIGGLLDGLNFILDLAIPEFRAQGGTLIIPGHGRVMDTGDVTNYRNMVAIIRDRIAALKAKGQTLAQVKTARPTLDYDGIYGSPDAFIEAIYSTLSEQPKGER